MNKIDRNPLPFYSTEHLARPSASQLIQEAKASLSRPSRPFTPHPKSRRVVKLAHEDIKALNEVLQPVAHSEPKKSTKRRVKLVSPTQDTVSESKVTLKEDSKPPTTDSKKEVIIDLWNEYLHYIEPFEKIDLLLLRISNLDTSDVVESKEEAQRWLVDQCVGILLESKDHRRIQEISTIILEFGREEKVLDQVLKVLLDISHDDIQIPFPRYIHCLLHCMNSASTMQKYSVISILKNMSDTVLCHEMLLQCGALEQVCEVLSSSPSSNVKELYTPLVGFVYNLIASNNCFELIQGTTVDQLSDLVSVHSPHYSDYSLVLVSFKTLAVLSEHPPFLEQISRQSLVTSLFDRMIESSQEPQHHTSILLRIFYILGNMTSLKLLNVEFISETLDDVVALFGIVVEEMHSESKQSIDLLLKMIRYIANIALVPEIGQELIQMAELHDLFRFLDDDDEEIQLNTASCLANLSFYTQPTDILFNELLKHSKKLITLLMNDNIEMVTETARILSNISRYPLSRTNPYTIHLAKISTALLDHQEPEIVSLACGILMNLFRNHATKDIVDAGCPEKYDNVTRILDVIEASLEGQNHRLAIIAAQALHNLLKNTQTSAGIDERLDKLLGKDITPTLRDILIRAKNLKAEMAVNVK